MFQRSLTEDEIANSILKGHQAAHDFMATNPNWENISDQIERLRFAAHHAVENFNSNKYILRGNRTKSEDIMRQMLLGSFRKIQELKELEGLRERGNNNVVSMVRASYLDYETQLPMAVTTFRSNGTVFMPDYKVARILNNYTHLTAA